MLQGRRVELRALSSEDVPRLCAFSRDLEVQLMAEFNPPRPQSLEAVCQEFQEWGRPGNQAGVDFAIVVGGTLIGTCGLGGVHPAHQTCDIHITIGDRNCWGQGYGRESVEVLLDYAFRIRNIRKVWLSVASTNERTLRCYRACGFVEEGCQRAQQWLDGQYVDAVLMGLLRDEWESASLASDEEA
jgi:RimJ/RimL family protein N-acetyltransferase